MIGFLAGDGEHFARVLIHQDLRAAHQAREHLPGGLGPGRDDHAVVGDAMADVILDAEDRAAYLAAVRDAADRRGVRVVLNARIDAIIRHPRRDPAAAMDEVLRRAHMYLDAGADCVYPIGLRDPALVAQVVNDLGRPVNVNPSEPLASLAEAGAARISLGGGVLVWMMGELQRRTARVLAGDATAFA